MSGSNMKPTAHKSSIPDMNKVPQKATVPSIAQAFRSCASNITNISIETSHFGHRNVVVAIEDVEGCEKAKSLGSVKIDGESCDLFFAQNRSNSPSFSAPQNKVCVEYPVGSDHDEAVMMLGDATFRKPEGAKNYFFATRKETDQQCELVKNFNDKKVEGGSLIAAVAIDKTIKGPIRITITADASNN